jgi:hypothetical protein
MSGDTTRAATPRVHLTGRHTRAARLSAIRATLYALLGAALLGACTGTTEPGNPVLLIVGQGDTEASEVILVEDTFAVRGATEDRFAFVEGSARPLPAPAVAYDVVDRTTTRRELVVLSRGTPQAGGAPAQLTFFALSGLNAANSGAFTQTRQLDFAELEILPNLPTPSFCPVDVQVTHNGLYAAVLNNPQVCGGNVINASVDILDLAGGRLLERVAGGVLPAGLYLNQTPAEDLLLFAVSAPGRINVQAATLPRPGASFAPGDSLEQRTLTTFQARLQQGPLQDLGVAGGAPTTGAARLVALFDEALINVPNYLGATPQPDAPIATRTGNRRLIRDDTLRTQATLILGAPQSNRFSFVPPPQQGAAPTPADGFVRAEAAVIQESGGSGSGFVYFASSLSGAQLSVFDLRGYREGATPSAVPFAVPEIAQPSFITWVQAAPAQPSTP